MLNYDQVEQTTSAFILSTEASMIGLPPGGWPEKIETTIGNKLPLTRGAQHKMHGDLIYVSYFQEAGCIQVRVYNT